MGHVPVHQDELEFGQDETIDDLEKGVKLSNLVPLSLVVIDPHSQVPGSGETLDYF